MLPSKELGYQFRRHFRRNVQDDKDNDGQQPYRSSTKFESKSNPDEVDECVPENGVTLKGTCFLSRNVILGSPRNNMNGAGKRIDALPTNVKRTTLIKQQYLRHVGRLRGSFVGMGKRACPQCVASPSSPVRYTVPGT